MLQAWVAEISIAATSVGMVMWDGAWCCNTIHTIVLYVYLFATAIHTSF